MKGIEIPKLQPETVKQVFTDLFCVPTSSLENPMYKSTASAARSYCILDQGELEGQFGYWVEDDQTLEVGLLQDTDDVFWLWDEPNSCWAARRFKGRRMRRGPPKGGGRGKGSRGQRHFMPFRSKGKPKGKSKGKSKSYATEDENWQQYQQQSQAQQTAAWSKSSKGKKGKGKGKKAGKGPGPEQANTVQDLSTAPAAEKTSSTAPAVVDSQQQQWSEEEDRKSVV